MVVCDQAGVAGHEEDDQWRRGAGRGLKRVLGWDVEECVG